MTSLGPIGNSPRPNGLLPRENSQISRRTTSSIKLLQAESGNSSNNNVGHGSSQPSQPIDSQGSPQKNYDPKLHQKRASRMASAFALLIPDFRKLERQGASMTSSLSLKRENKKLRTLLVIVGILFLGLVGFLATLTVRGPLKNHGLTRRQDTLDATSTTTPLNTLVAAPPVSGPGIEGPGLAIDGVLSEATIASVSSSLDEVQEQLKMDEWRSKTRKVDPVSLNGTEHEGFQKRDGPGTVAWFDVGADYPYEGAVYWGNDWGMSPDAWDNGPQLMNVVQACRNAGNCKILLRQGTYWFRESVIVFQDLHDFVLDGQNSIFMFIRNIPAATYAPLISVQRCIRCRFQAFTVDWDWYQQRLASIVRIVDANPRQWTFDFYDWYNVNLGIIRQYVSMHSIDQERLSMGLRDAIDGYFNVQQNLVSYDQLGPRTVRLNFGIDFYPVPTVNYLYLIRHWSYEMHAFLFVGCQHCVVDSVTIWSCPGKAMVIENESHNFLILNTRLVLKPGDNERHMTATADGFFMSRTQGNIRVENSEVSWQGDDCINIHDPTARGYEKIGWNEIRVHNAAIWRVDYRIGDHIELRNADWSPTGFQANIVNTYPIGIDQVYMAFDQGVPDFNSPGDIMIWNYRWNAQNVIIRNFYCHDNRARGVLMQVSNALLENSRFEHVQMSCVRATANSGMWAEGTGVKTFVVNNNIFDHCDKQNWGYGAIWTNLEDQEGQAVYSAGHQDIKIMNNTFRNMPGKVATIQSAQNVLFSNNVIISDQPSYPNLWDRGQIFIQYAFNLVTTWNRWQGQFTSGQLLRSDDSTTRALTNQGNYQA